MPQPLSTSSSHLIPPLSFRFLQCLDVGLQGARIFAFGLQFGLQLLDQPFQAQDFDFQLGRIVGNDGRRSCRGGRCG